MTAATPELDRLGGKGANLVKLAAAGLPVPRFVVVETYEYDVFVATNGLAPLITSAVAAQPARASDLIRAAFAGKEMAPEQRERLRSQLAPLLDEEGRLASPVAVRSSATAEDLPGFSFAGQQDTFLEVSTLDEVFERIVTCWSSLWTERAITYRQRNGIDHAGVRLAVVVQQMVDAEASGVLFTANPRTGRRDESVVDAVEGLGEALVSGQVIPDTFVLDPATGDVRSQEVAGSTASVSPTHLRALVALGRRIVELYGVPMDIEWARVGDELFVLQAREVTGLYPIPDVQLANPDAPGVWLSFGAFQGMLEPITPLGQEAIRMLMSGAPRIIGRKVDWRTNQFIQSAGQRIWIRIDPVLRVAATRKAFLQFLPNADPGAAAILTRLAEEPGLRATRPTPPPSLAVPIAALVARVGPKVRNAPNHPEALRRHLDKVTDQLVASVAAQLKIAAGKRTPQERLSARVDVLEWAGQHVMPTLLPAFAPIMLPTFLALHRLREVAKQTGLPDADALAMAVMRALPGNVTTDMDLALSDVAARIRRDATSWGWVAETPASDLAKQYQAGRLPRVAQEEIGAFLKQYGMRGVAEIDLGARRWREDPTPLMHTIKAYLGLPASAQPRAVHKAGQHEAGRSIRTLMDASTPARAAKIKKFATAIRALAGARETPKFTIIRVFGLLREGLDASAAELVAEGRLGAVEDIVFLRSEELRRAFSSDWHEVVARRRAVREAEARRGQVPRILVEDGRAFHEGLASESADITGVGVSPGVAEGRVRIVLDPRVTQLKHGEIMVCPGTDPAWTPLFLAAGGLITEVGGLMTHGSVVAREYGIPAVVGVHEATTRLKDGQRIRIDGTSGAIEVLDADSSDA